MKKTAKDQWRTGRSVVFQNTVHLVFVPKYRRTVFTDKLLTALESVLRETCLQMEGEMLEFNGEKDHVHLMISIHPKHAAAHVVGKLKGKSSYILRKEYWDDISPYLWGSHFWSPSYCLVSTGGASIDVVKEYIEKQSRPL